MDQPTTEAVTLPEELPEKPTGFTRRMNMHLNFGRAGGAASFDVFGPEGQPMPFGYQYDTRKNGLTGFTIKGREGVLTWAELRAEWPAFLKRKAEQC